MTVTVKNKTPLVVPPAVRRAAGLKSGQEIEFKVSGGVISIRPKLPAPDDEYTPEQRRIVDAQLAEGLADVAAGRVHGPFSTHQEFIASLHKEAEEVEPQEDQALGVMRLIRTTHFERNYAQGTATSPTCVRQAVSAVASESPSPLAPRQEVR